MNDEIKEKLKMKIAISQIKNEEKKVMNKKEKWKIQKNPFIVYICIYL